jgi:pilus assembly protein Flp/PilA
LNFIENTGRASPVSISRRKGGRKMKEKLLGFLRDEEGATAVEYGIMVALIAAVIVLMVGNVGQKVLTAFTDVNTALTP